MAIVTLTEAKEHLRVNHNLEDTKITRDIEAAEDYIKNYLNREEIPIKAAVKAAALLIVGDLYENRESQSEKELKANATVERLLFPYRVDMGI